MTDRTSTRYHGALQAVIFDWAGTTVDYGSFAPVVVFVELFKQRGVEITIEQARAPMGLAKKDHIRAIAGMAPVAAQWMAVHHRPCSEANIESMFEASIPLQAAVLLDHAALVPGVVETVAACRARGMKIGSTTGYSRSLMEILTPAAREAGYDPDTWVCPSDAPAGRPYPWMCYLNAIQLGVYPLSACVKVGDTVPDMEEGVNAGMWTVGVLKSGNELGLTLTEINRLSAAELELRLRPIRERLRAAGAHYLIDTVADLPPVVDAINQRLAAGEQP